MPQNICPKCGQPKEVKRSYCNPCFNVWQNEYKKTHRQVRTEEQKERQRFMDRQRIASMTPDKRQAYYDRKQAAADARAERNPEIKARIRAQAVARRVKWPKEKIERQQRSHKAHYERLQLRPAQGLCAYRKTCNEPPIGIQRFCLNHWCKAVLMVNEERITCAAEDLVSLWKRQEGKCAITGLTIIPGSTAELDHIVPVFLGGSGVIENLRYVHGMFNRMKSHMTDEELKKIVPEFCSKIIEWCNK